MRVSIAALTRYCVDAFVAMGASDEHAQILTRVLIEADLRGHVDHGCSLVAIFQADVEAKAIKIRPRVRVIAETPVSVVVDGDGGFGAIAASRAMDLCITRARTVGIGLAAVRNSSHSFYPSYYPLAAADAGFVGFFTTTSRPAIAPTGASERILGQNPICYAIPAARRPPILVDVGLAASIAKIRLARNEGQCIPEGWALDATGQPTTDAAAAMSGLLLPIGEHKGYGLSLAMDALVGLGGAPAGREAGGHGAVGHFMWALDPRLFGSDEQFRARVDELIDQVAGARLLADGGEIVYPGERGARRKAEAIGNGYLDLTATIIDGMDATARALGIAAPWRDTVT